MRTRSIASLGFTVLLAFGATAADAPGAGERERVVAGLQAWLDGTSRLEAAFRQSLVSGALGTTATESGRLYLERPGRIRWDYLDPEPKTAILIGDRTELYLAEDRQLVRGRLEPGAALFPSLLAGRDRVASAFDARLVGTPSDSGGVYRLRLTPRQAASGLSEVTLRLRPPQLAIEGAEILDDAGNRTVYVLSGARRNGKLPDGIFAFEPPPGTEVVDQP